ncbi:Apoptosis inducing protein, partial [Operophtera brumata]
MDSETENSPPLDVLFSSDYLVRSVYQWMPANIFIGPVPEIKSDDPGDQFEVNSRYIIVKYRLDDTRHNSWTQRYNIKTTLNNRRKRDVLVDAVDKDPYCLIPIETIKIRIENYNLMIVAKVLERAKKNNGLYNISSYNSCKDWYAGSHWEFDNSFAVGILGTDAKNGKDNWVNLIHDFTKTDGVKDYAGQVYFDKNGRPVAIVITSNALGQAGSGWSFIYNNGKWEYESTDSWDER